MMESPGELSVYLYPTRTREHEARTDTLDLDRSMIGGRRAFKVDHQPIEYSKLFKVDVDEARSE